MAGLFCVKDYCNHGHTGSYTLVTPQGKLYFAQLRGDDLAGLIRTEGSGFLWQEGEKQSGQLMEEMRQKARAQNYHIMTTWIFSDLRRTPAHDYFLMC